jgi:hypothetical protein
MWSTGFGAVAGWSAGAARTTKQGNDEGPGEARPSSEPIQREKMPCVAGNAKPVIR